MNIEGELRVEDLMSLEEYSKNRSNFRNKVMRHKKIRRVAIGPNLTIYFESKLTIQYQVQEMLRIERIFERQAVEEEFCAYASLIPDRHNLKATMMLEYVDAAVRRRKLTELKGIEKGIWLKIGNFERKFAFADEDLEREDKKKTSAVHFLRFAITSEMGIAMQRGDKLVIGVEHPAYGAEPSVIPKDTYESLLADLNCKRL